MINDLKLNSLKKVLNNKLVNTNHNLKSICSQDLADRRGVDDFKKCFFTGLQRSRKTGRWRDKTGLGENDGEKI